MVEKKNWKENQIKTCRHTPTWVNQRIERCKNCNTWRNRLKENQKEAAIENMYT